MKTKRDGSIVYLSIASIIILVWHKVLNQTFLGEGYFYFEKKLYLLKAWELPNLNDYDNFAKLFFQIVSPIFRDNLIFYLSIEIVIVVVFFWIFFAVIKYVTKDNFIAFISTVFLSTNYLALFEYIGAGNYQRFIQRFPNLIPALISFLFLWKFIYLKRARYLVLSLFFYVIAILMGHFSALILPLFVIFPTIQLFGNKIDFKKVLSNIIVCSIFVITTISLTSHSYQKPKYNIVDFLYTQENLIQKVFYQIPVVTVPLDLIKYIGTNLPVPISEPYTPIIKFLLIPCIVFYIIGGAIVFKKLPKLGVLYLTFFLSMISVMFTYLYTDTRLNVLKYFGQDRYYLLSSLFATILWAMILKAFFIKNKKLLIFTTTIIISLFIYYNTMHIWNHMESIQYKSEMNKELISYINENQYKYSKDSIIITPSYLHWPMPMIVRFSDKGITTDLPFENWQKVLWENKANIFVYDYNFPSDQSLQLGVNGGRIIDLTEKFRSGVKITFQK